MSHTQQTPDRLIGKEISGKYRIVKLLGEGGMGAVYLGEQKLGATIRKVAIKTLHPHLSHDEKILARFEREVGTVAALQHPNTIQVFDYGKMDDGQLYIVMEFVEGKSVASVLEESGPMEPARVQKILEQMCGSLEEAHSQGIVHRDLKPDNVVLCERAGQKDWVEVLDFGIAKRSTEEDKQEQKLTQQGMVLGTPPYMSPEQFTGKPIDKRSDIYSLGVMAFEMLTGSLPFSGNTAWEWATAHMTAQPVSMDTLPVGGRVPAAMKNAIQKALEKDPNQRWNTVTEFYQAFAQGVAALGAAAPAGADAPPRAKTEMGTPMPGGIYGAAPAAYPSGPQAAYPPQGAAPAHYATPPGAVPAQYGTPAQGNQSYTPFQGVAPGPPPRQRSGGGNGLIFALIGLGVLILVGSGVGYLVTRHSSGGGTAASTTADTATATATTTATATATATADTTAPLASLGTTTATAVNTGTKPTATTTVKPPTTTTTTTTATATTPTVTATTTVTAPPTVTTPPVAGPQECAAAVLMRKLGKVSESETLRIKCVEKGGKDPFAK